MPTAAERASPGMWPAQGWLRWPKLHHWGTLSTELPASPSTTETASENGTASNNKSHCDHGQAAAQNVSDNFSGSQLCQGDTTADEHGFSLGSTLNLADSSLNTYADRSNSSSNNWLHSTSHIQKTLSAELDDQRVCKGVQTVPAHPCDFPGPSLSQTSDNRTAHSYIPHPSTSVSTDMVLNPRCLQNSIAQPVLDEYKQYQNVRSPIKPPPSPLCMSDSEPASSTLALTPPSPFAQQAQRQSLSFSTLPTRPVTPGCGMLSETKPAVTPATGAAQSDLSLHDQQQFMQHDWLPLQQQQPKPVQQQSKPLQQQQPSFQSVSLPTQQQLLHGSTSRSLPTQSQSYLGGGELDDSLSSDMVRLDMQDCDVRSRRGNRSVTAEQVELGGFEFPSRGRVGGSSSWIARRALVLDSVWAAKDSE